MFEKKDIFILLDSQKKLSNQVSFKSNKCYIQPLIELLPSRPFFIRVGTAGLTINFKTGLGIELGNQFWDNFISKFLII
tara:strand:- start:349 stop:585 length:237 start_codon:yes stop_codon:yes gene_type:complete